MRFLFRIAGMQMYLHLVKILEDNYPEMMKKLFVVNGINIIPTRDHPPPPPPPPHHHHHHHHHHHPRLLHNRYHHGRCRHDC